MLKKTILSLCALSMPALGLLAADIDPQPCAVWLSREDRAFYRVVFGDDAPVYIARLCEELRKKSQRMADGEPEMLLLDGDRALIGEFLCQMEECKQAQRDQK